MFLDSRSSDNIMDDDALSMPIDMACQNPFIMSGNLSHSAIIHSRSHDLSEQNVIMDRFPSLPLMQDEQQDHLHCGFQWTNYASSSTSGALGLPCSSRLDKNVTGNASFERSLWIRKHEVSDQFMSETPLSAALCSNLLAARYDPSENLYDPTEVLRNFVSNDYSCVGQSSLGISTNCDYDMLSDLGSKLEVDEFYFPQLDRTVPQTTGLKTFQINDNMDQSKWILSENASISSDSSSCSSRYSNEVSTSVSTCQPTPIYVPTVPEHYSNISSTSLSSSLECDSNSLSSSFGYERGQLSQLLSGSSFLNVMQEILAELASYTFVNSVHWSYPSSGTGALENVSSSSSQPTGRRCTISSDNLPDGNDGILSGQLGEAKKQHLLNLLQMVDSRYNQCLKEIHKVISAFHAVTELDPQLHAHFALKTISLSYKSLRERISNYVLAMGAHLNRGGTMEEERSFEKSFIQKQWALQQLKRKEHQLWKTQRGLPERSVAVLRAWMFQNFLHPYPKDAEKELLAVKSGLTRSQVTNWFINARVRLWKPLIEEMYSEMKRRTGFRNGEETASQHKNIVSMDTQRFRMI